MLWWILSALLLLFIGYLTYAIFLSKDTETNTSLDDFIVKAPDQELDAGASSSSSSILCRYYSNYEEPGRQILLLYGTEYGFSEEIARKLFDEMSEDQDLRDMSLQPRVFNSKYFQRLDFSKESVALCIFSTSGDGVPPTDSRPFFDHLESWSSSSGPLAHLKFSVLALGDYNYPHYCRAGKMLDARLSELGGTCLYPRVDVDLEDWDAIERWMAGVSSSVKSLDLPVATDYLDLSMGQEEEGVSRTRPFLATMTVQYNLTTMGSPADKETFHSEFDLTSSDISYTAGDALGIYPRNNPPEVMAVLNALRAGRETRVPVPQFCYAPRPEGESMNLEDALTCYYDLKTIKLDLVKYLTDRAADPQQKERGLGLLEKGLSRSNQRLADYVSQRELVDLLLDFSSAQCRPEEVLGQLRPLQPRYYSIASSPMKSTDNISVCVAVVRYSLQATPRTGVCSTHIQDRMEVGRACPVFISHNPDFRLPQDKCLPIIMIGPGTGIAPFRAFLQERVLSGASGSNLLYFGCRHKSKDFLYRTELEQWEQAGVLKLRTAFSRDQPHKVYVQHLLAQDSQLLWKLLQDGAHVYVCGDAVSMAGDVHEELLSMLQREAPGKHGAGGMQLRCGKDVFSDNDKMGRSEAEEYMEKLEKAGRYQKDVWVT